MQKRLDKIQPVTETASSLTTSAALRKQITKNAH